MSKKYKFGDVVCHRGYKAIYICALTGEGLHRLAYSDGDIDAAHERDFSEWVEPVKFYVPMHADQCERCDFVRAIPSSDPCCRCVLRGEYRHHLESLDVPQKES